MTEYRTVVRYDDATETEALEWARFHNAPRGSLRVLVERDWRGERRAWPQDTGNPHFHELPVGSTLQY